MQELKTTKRTVKPVLRQEERVALTREKILSSAETIFARDGFEAAKLEEIASNAGYTRGAFYANYKNKEELFVAVARRQIARHFSTALQAVRSATDTESKIHEMLERTAGTAERTWVLLMIEFALFMLRHPQRKKHVTSITEQLVKGIETVYGELYAGAGEDLPFTRSIIGIGFYSLLQGLALQEVVNGSLVTPKLTNDMLRFYLYAVLGNEKNTGKSTTGHG